MTHRTPPSPKLVLARRPMAAAALALVLATALALGAALVTGPASGTAQLVLQGTKLAVGEAESGPGRFGRSVALSADGDTALVGAPRDSDEAGAVWVLTRSGSTWTPQAKLTGGGELGEAHFGRSVALSADGDTALVGGPNDGGVGAAWVFTRAGSTWTQQAELTGGEESGSGWFGQSVALSADGDTALVGGFNDHSQLGAAWVFVRSGAGVGATWSQQGAKLTAADESGPGEFGWSVALSADGATALIGARHDGEGLGAAWVFVRAGAGAGATWSQQGAKLTAADESGPGELGQSGALSADGAIALVGGFHDNEGRGAAWVFARAGSGAGATWSQQGPKLTGEGELGGGLFGASVALTPDGDTALVGGFRDGEGAGAAWEFASAGSGVGATWSQQGAKLTGGEERGRGEFGWSVALAGDGQSALVGGVGDSTKAGAAWAFGEAPPAPPDGGGGGPQGGPPPGGQTAPTQTQTAPAGAGATPKQGVAGSIASGGRVALLGRRLAVRGGRVRVRLRCLAPTSCSGRLTLTIVVRARAASTRAVVSRVARGFSIEAGATVTVVLPLRRGGRTRLRARRGRLPASLAIRVLAPAPARTHAYAVRLVAGSARRR